MTFEDVLTSIFETSLPGTELVALYVFLAENEDRLDNNQLAALGRLRSILYERLSIEELESMPEMYSGKARRGV